MGPTSTCVHRLRAEDIEGILAYWAAATPAYLEGMGVDVSKLASAEDLRARLLGQVATPIEARAAHCLIWELDGRAVGHCNTNPTAFGDHAYMHLHLWDPGERRKGLGTAFVTESLRFFFADLQLRELFCQPFANNLAPHRTLARVGFELDAELVITPSPIAFEQPVKRWRMTRARFEALTGTA